MHVVDISGARFFRRRVDLKSTFWMKILFVGCLRRKKKMEWMALNMVNPKTQIRHLSLIERPPFLILEEWSCVVHSLGTIPPRSLIVACLVTP